MISKHEYIKHFWEKCNSKFNREDQLKRHKDVKHGNVKKKHLCGVCGNSFNYKDSLKKYYLIHAGKKPHKCAKCKSSFRQKEFFCDLQL